MYKQLNRFNWKMFNTIENELREAFWWRVPEVVKNVDPQSIPDMNYDPNDENNVAGVWLTAFTNGHSTRCFCIVTENLNEREGHTRDVIYEFERVAVDTSDIPW